MPKKKPGSAKKARPSTAERPTTPRGNVTPARQTKQAASKGVHAAQLREDGTTTAIPGPRRAETSLEDAVSPVEPVSVEHNGHGQGEARDTMERPSDVTEDSVPEHVATTVPGSSGPVEMVGAVVTPPAPEVTGSVTEPAAPDVPRVAIGTEDVAPAERPEVMTSPPEATDRADAPEDVQTVENPVAEATAALPDTNGSLEQEIAAREPRAGLTQEEARGLAIPGVRYLQLRAEDAGAHAVDGLEPRFIASPATLQEMADLLRDAAADGLAVIPRGGGTKMALGNIPRAVDLVLSTRRLDQILDYTPADLTITVQAGLRLADLQETLHREGQFLPLDPPGGREATIGGVIAANASGPRRLRYGSARDLVIGVRVAQTDGNVTKAGAKVVKNVAGYDLNKLYVGSLGTLVVLGEINFKLTPLPELYRAIVCVMPNVDAAMATVGSILHSPLWPTALEVVNAEARRRIPALQAYGDGDTGVLLVAEADGFAKGVARQMTDIETFARANGASACAAVNPEEATALWSSLREVGFDAGVQRAVALKIAVPTASVAQLVAAVEAAFPGDPAPIVISHAGSGIIYVYAGDGDTAEDALKAAILALRQTAVSAGGSLVVERCATSLKASLDVWGDAGPALRIMRALKTTFDPQGVLNPGRYVGGI